MWRPVTIDFKRLHSLMLCLMLCLMLNGFWAQANIIGGGTSKTAVDCKSFCSQFGIASLNLSGATQSSPGGINLNDPTQPSESAWSKADDAICDQIGNPTNTGVMIKPVPTTTVVPEAEMTSSACSINYGSFAVGGNSDADKCAAAGQILTHCQYHNSQVEQQCMAFNAATASGDNALHLDRALMIMDLVVAAECATECALTLGVDLGGSPVCAIMAMVEGMTEFASSIAMQFMPLSKYLASQGDQTAEGLNYAEAGLGAAGVAAAASKLAISGIIQDTGTGTTPGPRKVALDAKLQQPKLDLKATSDTREAAEKTFDAAQKDVQAKLEGFRQTPVTASQADVDAAKNAEKMLTEP